MDYHENFTQTHLRLIFAIITYINLELHHVDIETTFLHGDLKEEMYMEQAQLLKDELHPNYVYKLHKPLYGLKQTPTQWYAKLHRFLLTNSFVQLQSEPTL